MSKALKLSGVTITKDGEHGKLKYKIPATMGAEGFERFKMKYAKQILRFKTQK